MFKRVGVLLALTSITTSPWTTYDPINPFKFLLLGVCGCSCLVFMLMNRKSLQLNKLVVFFSLAFVSQALLSTIFSEANFAQNLFGDYGRYFGLFTWVMLFSVMVFFSQFQKFTFLLRLFLIVGALSLAYSIVQYLGKDPAPWDNNYNNILGFLGNPNFQSSFLGLFLVALGGSVLIQFKSLPNLLLFFLLAGVTVLMILLSSSIQGIFVAAAGMASFGMYYLFAKKFFKIYWLLLVSVISTCILFILSVIALGPLAPLINKGTLAIRGDYWLTALSMARDNLFTGVGPDQFGTWYRFYRNPDALTRVNSEVVTNSAHNGYLDFAANLGIIALLAYMFLLIYAIIAIGRYIKQRESIDLTHATLVALFFGFQAQFLISPNQIGLVIWGWVFLGAIFGYDNVYSINRDEAAKLRKNSKNFAQSNDNISVIASTLIGTLLGTLITGPIIYSSTQFRTALVKADALRIISAVNIWPRSEELVIYSVSLLFSNNLQQQGKELLISGLEEFPNSYGLWRLKYTFRYITEDEKREVRSQLHRLDPLNPEWAPKE